MNRVHFSLTDEELDYLDELKKEKNCSSRSKVLSLIINEYKKNSDTTIESLYKFIADRITEQLKDEFKNFKNDMAKEISSGISPSINKLRYATNSVSKDTQIILEMFNGIYYNENYKVFPSIENYPTSAYKKSVERVENKIEKAHYKKSNTLY